MRTPSVTQIIAPWTAEDFARIPRATLEAAAERGTAVHDACAVIARGLMVVNMAEGIRGYVESFRRWFDRVVDEVIHVEVRLADEAFGFHGQPDILVRAKHGEILLVDLKTPLAKSKSWRLQMAGYVRLCQVAGIQPDRAGSLRLIGDGGVPRMDWYEDGAGDFNVFISALNVWRFFNSEG